MAAVAELIRPDMNVVSDQQINEARSRLIVALDFDTIDEARALVKTLGDEVEFYKIGLGLQLADGGAFARQLKGLGKKVFLDYKYHDIGNTIENAVRRAAELEIDFLTVHGTSSILECAVRGKGESKLKLFFVTVLTNMDAKDLEEMGYPLNTKVKDIVVHRAKKALEAGIDGVIASGVEAAAIKAVAGGRLMVISPGIRPDGSPVDDQKRVMTPREAIESGADYLVIGRPILNAESPKEAARAIVREMAEALAEGINAASTPSTGMTPDA
ncbi:orotidine-5'-phosphate decarboxylase [Methylocystis sp. B8]|uniref:orotidine-5'-phosphate decarboxylase n=1 Tax=Methylocystis sp. B8 TaxID=544938 RepID=UPI0010FD53FD|nr:orotidine-5'-phosphate decarboxylase [Methylocystis sp. B8]TLG78524.1 orotidine-5'-phosphate decarboxylase [Methylocystis sp. B8]